MSEKNKLEAHLFICTNERKNDECCAGKGSVELRERVKKITKDKKEWNGRVRVNTAGCLGHCMEGITAVIYPQGKWMTHLTKDSVAEIEKSLSEILD